MALVGGGWQATKCERQAQKGAAPLRYVRVRKLVDRRPAVERARAHTREALGRHARQEASKIVVKNYALVLVRILPGTRGHGVKTKGVNIIHSIFNQFALLSSLGDTNVPTICNRQAEHWIPLTGHRS